MIRQLGNAQATDALGRALARSRPAQAIVHLHGDLGAGKSTLARALLRELGVTGAIRSPTYTLLERYPLRDGGEAWHLDLYRIAAADELDFLGLDDNGAELWLVEWPERGGTALPAPDLRIVLALQGEGRVAHLQAASRIGTDWLQRLGDSGQLRHLSAAN